MNLIHIAGHLGSEPEIRHTPNGQKVISFRIATRSRRGGQEDTIWYRVTIWGDRFDRMLPYLKKGSAVIVVGELQKPEIFTNRDNQPQVSLEVTAEAIRFSPFGRSEKQGDAGGQSQQVYAQPAAAPTGANNSFGSDDFSNDDLPF